MIRRLLRRILRKIGSAMFAPQAEALQKGLRRVLEQGRGSKQDVIEELRQQGTHQREALERLRAELGQLNSRLNAIEDLSRETLGASRRLDAMAQTGQETLEFARKGLSATETAQTIAASTSSTIKRELLAASETARKDILTEIHSDTRRMNLRRKLQDAATASTAEYIRDKMSTIQSVNSLFKVHDVALAAVELDGLILEFGVHSGRTVNYIAGKRPDLTVHGFDSFKGLPEPWRDGFDTGVFSLNGLPEVRENVRLHVGLFADVIPGFLQDHMKPDSVISYIHIDCDLYSSTKDIFGLLGKYLQRGSVIVFDEYFNYHGWQNGEFLAFQEFLQDCGLSYEYLTYNHLHENVAVRLR